MASKTPVGHVITQFRIVHNSALKNTLITELWKTSNTQKDLSHQQLHWQEFLSQYDMTITYIPGEDNSVTNALSRVALNAFPDEMPALVECQQCG